MSKNDRYEVVQREGRYVIVDGARDVATFSDRYEAEKFTTIVNAAESK